MLDFSKLPLTRLTFTPNWNSELNFLEVNNRKNSNVSKNIEKY